MVVYAAGSGLIAKLIKDIVDGLLAAQNGGAGATATDGIHRGVLGLAVWILTAYFFKGVGAWASSYLMADVGQRVVMDLRNRLYRHILDQSAAFFSRASSGQLVSKITNDVNQIQQAVGETVADLIRETLSVVAYAGLLFWLDWRLAIVVLTGAPLAVYPLVRLGQRVRSTTRRGQEQLEQVTHLAAQGFTGHRIVKAFGAEARETDRFKRATASLYRTNMRITGAVASLPPLMEFIGGVAAVAALWYGATRIAQGELTPGAFASFLGAAFMMYGPIKKLSRVNAGLQQAIAASERIFEMLDTHTEVVDVAGAPALARMAKSVEFKDVGFAYADRADRLVLEHVSFTAHSGQVIALVGLSGAGKTTLVNLIPRFYDVTAGAIFVDGVD